MARCEGENYLSRVGHGILQIVLYCYSCCAQCKFCSELSISAYFLLLLYPFCPCQAY